jgi:HEPN domain-containing protein
MNELPDNNYEEARRWAGNADADLRAMQAVEKDEGSPRRVVCFMAHLVVEKALKATLIDAEVPFGKTHDLLELHDLCSQAGRMLEIQREELARLNPWAVDGRYADDLAEAEQPLARELADFAVEVMTAVRSEMEDIR